MGLPVRGEPTAARQSSAGSVHGVVACHPVSGCDLGRSGQEFAPIADPLEAQILQRIEMSAQGNAVLAHEPRQDR